MRVFCDNHVAPRCGYHLQWPSHHTRIEPNCNVILAINTQLCGKFAISEESTELLNESSHGIFGVEIMKPESLPAEEKRLIQ